MEGRALEAVIAAMQEQDKAEAKEVDKLLAKAFMIGRSGGPQPEMLRSEIEELEAALKRAHAEREERRAEMSALPRIELYQRTRSHPLNTSEIALFVSFPFQVEAFAMVAIFRRKLGWSRRFRCAGCRRRVSRGGRVLYAQRPLGVGQYTATAYITFVESKSTPLTVGD